MVLNEKVFPRGGFVNAEAKTKESSSNILFGATQKKIKKVSKLKNNLLNEDDDANQVFKAVSAEPITYDTLQDDMLVMGVVRSVAPTSLSVALPGRLTARVLVADVSHTYTKLAKSVIESGNVSEFKDFAALFSEGSIVYGRPIKPQEGNKKLSLLLTLKPSEVHERLLHANVKKGFIFSGAISEIQEHGYVIETGIQGLKGFVQCEQSKQNRALGELAFLKVKRIQHSPNQSTCTCIELEQHSLNIKSQVEPNLDYILPGSIVSFKVNKHLKNGLQGTIMNEAFTAYVNENHLAEAQHKPEDYELNEKYNARVLYVMPLTKLVYLTLNLDIKVHPEETGDASDAKVPKKGSIITNAKVVRVAKGGVILLLNKKYKGVITYGSIKCKFTGNYDQDELLAKYANNTKHQVRVLGYDVIEGIYYCSDNPNVVNEEHYTWESIKPGDTVSARILKADESIHGYLVKIGRLTGKIEKLFLAPNVKYSEGTELRCRVMDVNVERKICYLTNRLEYMKKDAKLLTSLQAAHVGNVYMGTVVTSEPGMVLVKFLNGIKGVLYRQTGNANALRDGQTLKFRIYSKKGDQIVLTLPENKFKFGEVCRIEITNTLLDVGLECTASLEIEEREISLDGEPEKFVGLVPLRLLSDHLDLCQAQMRVCALGTQTRATCMNENIFSLRDVAYFNNNKIKNLQAVKVGEILRAYVKHATETVVDLQLPVQNYNKLVKLHVKMLRLSVVDSKPIELTPEQILYVKVLSNHLETRTLTVSAILTDVWSGDLSETAKIFRSYLKEVEGIKKALKKQGAPIATHFIGEKIKVVFQGISDDTGDWVYLLKGSSNITALLKPHLAGAESAPAVGTKHQAVVLWIDYASDVLLINNKSVEHVTSDKELPSNLIGKSGLKAKCLLKLESVVVCSLKRPGNPLVMCPIRLHYNDVENSASSCFREGDFCNLTFIHHKHPIAVPDSVWKIWKGLKRAAVETQEASSPKKAKIQEPARKSKAVTATVPLTNGTHKKANQINGQDVLLANGIETPKAGLIYEDKTAGKPIKNQERETAELVKARLPGVSNFWQADMNSLHDQQVSASSDEEDENAEEAAENQSKKKRLNSKEKTKVEQKEEQRLREIEERNADPTQRPQTIDQFERLVLAEPNNSTRWIEYITFFVTNAEIEKARDVAQRAIKTIAFRFPEELLNVWSARLSLELMYNINGFDDVLKEALTHNDPLKIYKCTVKLFKKTDHKERLLSILAIMQRKFKADPSVWRLSAETYFLIGMTGHVQPTLQRALTLLPKQEHVNCIVSYATLYAKYNDSAKAQSLLDDVVTSYPKRTDIWILYVDMLIKAGLFESARNTLERAVHHKLRPNKMVILYKKYLEFEEKYGTAEGANKVKAMATQYVKSYNNEVNGAE